MKNYRGHFQNIVDNEFILATCYKYIEFSRLLIQDAVNWRGIGKLDLKSNDLISIVKRHPALANDLLDATDFCDEALIDDEKERQVLMMLANKKPSEIVEEISSFTP